MSAVAFAVALPTLLVAHSVGDHWVQTNHQACTKGLPGWAGRWACVKHVATLTATKFLLLAVSIGVLGLDVHPGFVAAALLVDAASHYWADRRVTLAALADAMEPLTGKGSFYRLGSPREGRDDNPGLGTGAYALDQAFHHFWLLVAALIIAGGA